MKNIHVFAAELPDLNVLIQNLSEQDGLYFQPLTDSQWGKVGLHQEAIIELSNGYRIDFIASFKKMPKALIVEESNARLEIVTNDHPLTDAMIKNELGSILEIVTLEYCARIPPETVHFSAYYHSEKQTLIFDSKEELSQSGLGLLLKPLGSIETKTLHCSGISNSLTTNMQSCLLEAVEHERDIKFSEFKVGDLLVMENEHKDIARFKGDYPLEQISELLSDGYKIKEINLSKDGISFNLNEKFKIKNIKNLIDFSELEFEDKNARKLHIQELELEIIANHCEELRRFFDKQNEPN